MDGDLISYKNNRKAIFPHFFMKINQYTKEMGGTQLSIQITVKLSNFVANKVTLHFVSYFATVNKHFFPCVELTT